MMNKELARVLNFVVLVVTIAILLSWVYTTLDKAGIVSVKGYQIRYGFFAVQAAMETVILVLLSLHCRNRRKLGDNLFRFPMHGTGALSIIGLYDTCEALLQIGEDLSILKIVVVSAVLVYVFVQFIISKNRNEFV